MQPVMERSPLTSGRSATPADINRYGWPTSIGTGGRHQIGMPGRHHRNAHARKTKTVTTARIRTANGQAKGTNSFIVMLRLNRRLAYHDGWYCGVKETSKTYVVRRSKL